MKAKPYELAVIGVALALLATEVRLGWTSVQEMGGITLSQWLWGIGVGAQMLVTKYLRVPIAPGKWYDFTYVPMWVLVFTLSAPVAFVLLVVFSIVIYALFPNQFYCRKTAWTYMFHLSYQIVLFSATIYGFRFFADHVHVSLWGVSLTGTIAMFGSMFALMFADTLLGGWIQSMDGQPKAWAEWRRDYLRITVIQTLLSTIAMLFSVLYLTGHPVQLAAAYGFFLLGVWVMYRSSFRQDDFMGLIRSMISMVEIKDTYTKNHSESVGHYSVVLGQMAGLPASRLERLRIAAQLHDIGKIGIPDAILKKEGPLTDEEFEVMRTHAELGEKVLQPIRSLGMEARIIGRHHEHMDGRGYPYRASGGDIPLEARIISIADAYHAMISHRPYRRGLGAEEALARLHASKGTQFDPEFVELFAKYVESPANFTYRFRPFCLVH